MPRRARNEARGPREPYPRPHGRAPRDHAEPCEWHFTGGFWRDLAGNEYVQAKSHKKQKVLSAG